MWEAVISHCSSSVFSAGEYCNRQYVVCSNAKGRVLTSVDEKMAEEALTGSSPASLACGYDFSSKLLTALSIVAMIAEALDWNVFEIDVNGC